MTWVVIANSNACRIYHYSKIPSKIVLIKEINHPENRLKTGDFLTSDRAGHYQTDGGARGSYMPHTDPKTVEIANFSREIASELNQGRNTQAYKELILITPPHMNGILSANLDKNVKSLVKKEIQKDVMHLAPQELLDFLKVHLKPA